MQKTEIRIRPPKPSDLSFIFASFSNSMKRDSELGRSTRTTIFFREFQKVIDRLLNTSAVLIACSPEEEDAIMGYLIFEQKIIHYAWVRPSCRNKGIARALFRKSELSEFSEYSLNTQDAKKITKDHKDFTYNPFILFKKEADCGQKATE